MNHEDETELDFAKGIEDSIKASRRKGLPLTRIIVQLSGMIIKAAFEIDYKE